jgi:uncharacterized iron-regulated protein
MHTLIMAGLMLLGSMSGSTASVFASDDIRYCDNRIATVVDSPAAWPTTFGQLVARIEPAQLVGYAHDGADTPLARIRTDNDRISQPCPHL